MNVKYFVVSKKNPYTQKHYRVEIEEQDITDSVDHDNDVIPQIVDPFECGYCHKHFPSRNRLFYHLGFMGIDIWSADKVYFDKTTRNVKRKYRKQEARLDSVFKKMKI